MDDLYFECDWVIDLDKSYAPLENLRKTASELRLALSYHYKRTIEGYYVLGFIVHVPSQTLLNEFIKRAAEPMGLVNWSPAQASDYPGYTIHPHPTQPMLSPSWVDEMHSRAKVNRMLQEKLKTHPVLFFACDWVIPGHLPNNWLEKISSACSRGGIVGFEIRTDPRELKKDQFYEQRFVVRLYSEEEFNRLSKYMKEIAGLDNWFPATSEDFLRAVPIFEVSRISGNEEKRLRVEIPKLSQANAEIGRKLNSADRNKP